MRSNIAFHPLAEQELYDAAAYYSAADSILGEIFLAEVERSLSILLEHPQAFPYIRYPVRRKTLRGFPYSIMYADGGEIHILAIAHQKRQPSYWSNRQENGNNDF